MTADGEHVYVYFDSNEKITSNLLSKKVFVRVANLHKPQPLVQINDLIFKGCYEECVGTNLFFEEEENPPPKTNIHEKETPIRLKPIMKQSKMLKLQQMKLPKKAPATKLSQDQIKLDLNHDYETVLKKLEQGVLNIDDLNDKQSENYQEERIENPYLDSLHEITNLTEPINEIDSHLALLGDESPSNLLEIKYERLKRIARQPVQRLQSQEFVEEPEEKWKKAYEYHNLEKVILQDPFFRSTTSPMLAQSYIGGVDFEGCYLQGVIKKQNGNKISKEHINDVFTINNLQNLSIPGRYLVLKECVNQIKELLDNSNEFETETDESGRDIKEIYNIFERLLNALKEKLQTQEYKVEVHFPQEETLLGQKQDVN